MTEGRWLIVAVIVGALGAFAASSRAGDVLILEHNGAEMVLHQGRLIAWNYSGNVMQLEYETDRIFGDGFE